MRVFFGQIYIEQGAEFPFTCAFQQYLSREVTLLVAPSAQFTMKYGEDFDLIFRISAKHDLQQNDIRGPTVFRKGKDVDYTVFLPYSVIFESRIRRRLR